MSFWDNNPASMAAASLGGGMAGGVTSLPGVASMAGGSPGGGAMFDQRQQSTFDPAMSNGITQVAHGASPGTPLMPGQMGTVGQPQTPGAPSGAGPIGGVGGGIGGGIGSPFAGSTLASLGGMFGGMFGGMGSPQTSYGSSGYGSPQAGQTPTGDTGYAQMRAPNGDTDWVHPDHIDHYTSLGATRL